MLRAKTSILLLALAMLCTLAVGNAEGQFPVTRAVYDGHMVEYGPYYILYPWSYYHPRSDNDDELLANEITWAAGGPAPMTKVCWISGWANYSSYVWSRIVQFENRHPQFDFVDVLARPITASLLANPDGSGDPCNVVVLSDAWQHQIYTWLPSWLYYPSEGEAILNHAQGYQAGILLTSGSFCVYATDGIDSNYNTFAEMMGVEAVGKPFTPPNGDCPYNFSWGYHSSYYGAPECMWDSYILGASPYWYRVEDPGHEINWLPFPIWDRQYMSTGAQAGLMAVTEAERVGHTDTRSLYNANLFSETLVTAGEIATLPVDWEITIVGGMPFKGHPVVVHVKATHNGEVPDPILVTPEDLVVTGDIGDMPVTLRAEPDVGNGKYYLSIFNDDNNDGEMDPGDSIEVVFALIMPWGPPDEEFSFGTKLCMGKACSSSSGTVTTDSCKHNTDDPWDELSVYRHFQKALVFIRTDWRNAGGDVAGGIDADPAAGQWDEALMTLLQNVDQAFKDAHSLVSSTSPGPGNYNLELIHENLDEGNCQFGVTGSWLKDNL